MVGEREPDLIPFFDYLNISKTYSEYSMGNSTQTEDAGYWFSAGERERDTGNSRQAQLCFERAVTLEPHNAVYWSELGLAMNENDETADEALRCIRRALELDPKCAAIWSGKGVVLFRQGDIEASIVAFERASRLNPHEADYWMNLGLAYAAGEEYKKSLPAFENGIEITPTDARFWERKGTILLALGEDIRAEHCFAQAKYFEVR